MYKFFVALNIWVGYAFIDNEKYSYPTKHLSATIENWRLRCRNQYNALKLLKERISPNSARWDKEYDAWQKEREQLSARWWQRRDRKKAILSDQKLCSLGKRSSELTARARTEFMRGNTY